MEESQAEVMARFWDRLEAVRHMVKTAERKVEAEEMGRKVEAVGRDAEAARGAKLGVEVARLWKKKGTSSRLWVVVHGDPN